MSEPRKILANDPTLSDEEAKQQYRLTNGQEEAIIQILDEVSASNGALLADDMGVGKAQPLDSLVLTPQGFIPMGEMTVGQEVVSPDGAVARVSGVFPQGERPIFRVTLSDGRSVEADGEHIWSVTTTNRIARRSGAVQKTTLEMQESLTYGSRGNAQWYVEMVAPVDLGEWSSSLDPYLLGLLLGDGGLTTNTPRITTVDQEIVEAVAGLLPPGISLHEDGDISYRLSGTRPRANAVTVELRRLGLMGHGSHTKFIPAELLNSSVADRLALLQGLLDTDGSVSRGGFEFTSASYDLADAVVWLTRSLGGRCSIKPKRADGKTFWRTIGKLSPDLAPFRLSRKLAALRPATKYPIIALAITSIVYIGMKPAQCIMVDSELHEYVTDGFTRTHNTVQATEVIVRAGFTRALVIALPDTHDQWVERISLQSDGAINPRVMNGTKAGKANLAAFRAGEEGIFIAGSAYLMAQDWQSVRVEDPERGGWMFKRHKSSNRLKGQIKGQLVLRDRPATLVTTMWTLEPRPEGEIGPAEIPHLGRVSAPVIGPAQEPVIETKSKRIHFFDYRLKKRPIQALVFDEVQAIANKHAHARATIRSICTADTFFLAMSGTWFLNNPDNMWSIGRMVWPGLNPETGRPYVETNHDTWRHIFMERVQATNAEGEPLYSPSGRAILKVVGEKEPGAFVASLPCYIRREADDPIPEPAYIYVDPTPQQKAQMEDLEKDLMTWVMLWDGTEEPLVTDLPPELHIRLRQLTIAELTIDERGDVAMADDAASAKLAPLRGLIEQEWAGQPVAIYTDSKIGAKFIERRMRRAGVDVRAWTGDLTKKQRNALKASFIEGEFPYLIATVQSFGTGIDGLQRVCDKVIWISEADGNAAINNQAIRRFLRPHRLKRGGVDQFQHVKILMRDSVDVVSMQNLIHKNWLIRQSITLAA